MKQTKRRQRGFTLGESLIALAILSIAAGALIPIFNTGIRLTAEREERFRLHYAAQQALASLSADVAAGAGEISRESIIDGMRISEQAETASALDGGGTFQTLYRVTVTTTTSAGARRREVTLIDYVTTENAR